MTDHKENKDWMESLRERVLAGEDVSPSDVDRVRELATASHDEARFALGTWYVFGSYGLEKDSDLGVGLVEQAARMGNHDALNWMGLHFEEGNDVDVNDGRALNYYICAAVLGNRDAKYNVYRFMEEGIWLEEDQGLANLLRATEDG